MENNVKKCKYCQSEIPSEAKICPNCNNKQGAKTWQIILIVVVGLLWWGIVFNVLFSGSDETGEQKNTLNENNTTIHQNTGNSKGGSLANPTTTQTSKKTEYSVGEIYEDNYLAIKYVSCDNNFTNYSKYTDIKSGYKIVKVEFEVENVGNADEFISSLDFECYADGYACDSFIWHDETYLSATLSSGKKTKGALLYEVPTNAQKVILEYEPNIFLNEKITFIIQ